MKRELPVHLVEPLLSLGRAGKEVIHSDLELIGWLAEMKGSLGSYDADAWQELCGDLSRDEHVLLFRGLVYADILSWGGRADTPVNPVFAKLNTRCWPDTVYALIRWAVDVCAYHQFDAGNYPFAGMLDNR
jgi:hypothetical protein